MQRRVPKSGDKSQHSILSKWVKFKMEDGTQDNSQRTPS
jgi:hypothetical protein